MGLGDATPEDHPMMDRSVQLFVTKRISEAIAVAKKETAPVLRLPRNAQFTLTNIAVGTVEQDVSWQVPIAGDYTIVVAPTTGAAVVGFVSATVKAGTKLPLGCTVIVANRSAATIAAAAFDVLAFPIGGG